MRMVGDGNDLSKRKVGKGIRGISKRGLLIERLFVNGAKKGR
jgi:hypothetical protein